MNTAGWQARLDLGFSRRGERTLLTRRQHHGPLTVQRPFYPEGGGCHVYILHPPGGVVSGDHLELRIQADEAADVLLTTPAAGKFYRSEGLWARQSVTLTVGRNARLEWLPQETIFYRGAKARCDVRVDLSPGGRFIGFEPFVLGRPAAGEGFDEGIIRLNSDIYLDGKPLLLEHFQLDGATLNAVWGLRQHPLGATLWAYPATTASLRQVQAMIAGCQNSGVTLLGELLVFRTASLQVDELHQRLRNIWSILRPEIMDKPPSPPRIWAT